MNSAFRLLICLLLVVSPAAGRRVVVAYVPNWIDLETFAETIDCSKVTHLNIAFENPLNDAGDLSFNHANQALMRKAQQHGVKVLVSIGGGSASTDPVLMDRYVKLTSEKHRSDFAVKLAEYVVEHGFDGLDVDIEGAIDHRRLWTADC